MHKHPNNRLVYSSTDDFDQGKPPIFLRCDCNAKLDWNGPGADYSCDKCGREYNSAAQLLAPRSQWGEETGETAADYYAGFNNPSSAFDGDY